MKRDRALFVLATPEYEPELCEVTFPLLKRYADTLRADFVRLETRQYPDFPITYERMQIHKLGQGNEWNICIDPDILVHPSIDDFTTWFPKEQVGNWCFYDARQHFAVENEPHFLRDGRFYGIVDCLIATSSWTHDLWTPLPGTLHDYEHFIKDKNEVRRISEFTVSSNLARYGMKISGMLGRVKHVYHIGATSNRVERPADEARRVLREWGV
jgi:hypothetical protein